MKDGGARRPRTDDLKLAKLALSQLSYGPNLVSLPNLPDRPAGPQAHPVPGPKALSPPGPKARDGKPSARRADQRREPDDGGPEKI